MPTRPALGRRAGLAGNRLTFVMTRQRVSPFPPRSDPETTISRQFTLPTARTFTLSGSASLSALVPDDEIDRLGRPPPTTGMVAYSSGRLPGDLAADGLGHHRRRPDDGLAARPGARPRWDPALDLRPDASRSPSATCLAGHRRRPPLGAHGHSPSPRATRCAPSPCPRSRMAVPGAVGRPGDLRSPQAPTSSSPSPAYVTSTPPTTTRPGPWRSRWASPRSGSLAWLGPAPGAASGLLRLDLLTSTDSPSVSIVGSAPTRSVAVRSRWSPAGLTTRASR